MTSNLSFKLSDSCCKELTIQSPLSTWAGAGHEPSKLQSCKAWTNHLFWALLQNRDLTIFKSLFSMSGAWEIFTQIISFEPYSKSICGFHPPEFRWSWSLYFFGLHFLYGNMTTKNFSLSWEETSDHGPIEDTWNCLQVSLCPFYLMKSSPLMLGLLVLSQVLIFLVTSLMFFNFFRTVGLLFLALLLFLIAVVLFTSFFCS